MSMAACGVGDRPEAPDIAIVTWPGQPLLDTYSDGASVWSPLGFDVSGSDLPECERHWYETGNVDCVITIGIRRDPMLREREGTNALSNRADRSITIDTSVTNAYDLTVAVAHEVGHIVLDTAEHTRGGVMGGASAQLEAVDYELACRAINICVD